MVRKKQKKQNNYMVRDFWDTLYSILQLQRKPKLGHMRPKGRGFHIAVLSKYRNIVTS